MIPSGLTTSDNHNLLTLGFSLGIPRLESGAINDPSGLTTSDNHNLLTLGFSLGIPGLKSGAINDPLRTPDYFPSDLIRNFAA